MTQTVFLALGSNLGDRYGFLLQALDHLTTKLNAKLLLSPIYETKAWGKTDQPDFLNCCVVGEVSQTPLELIKITQAIELALGRERNIRWGPRTIDIDILAMGQLQLQTEELVLPHPALDQRRFVLKPWADLAPSFVVPSYNQTVQQLLSSCVDDQIPLLWDNPSRSQNTV